MTKEKFLELNEDQITEEIIAEIYDCSLNAGIDYVDSVEIGETGIDIYYYYDGEPCIQTFSSVEVFRFHVKTYGK